MSLSHQSVQNHLQSGQRLTQAEQAAVDEHLAACPECRAYAAFHRNLLDTLPAGNAPLRHSEREIRQQINIVSARLEQRRWPNRIFRSTLSLAGVAVSMVLLLLVLIYIPRMMPARSTPATQAMLAPQATRLVSSNFSSTSAPIATPTPSAISTLPSLPAFPIQPGTTWEYTNTGYSQAVGDPQKIIQGTTRMKESITSVQTVPPYTFVHVQGNKTMVSADEGWQENGAFGLGDYEYWYVIQNNQVYLSYSAPDPTRINPDQVLLKYQFPMARGSEWCTTTLRRGSVEHPTPDPNSPCESPRVVMNLGPYPSQVGELKSCYEIHDVANSGDTVTQFCEGIGIASVKYGHAGSQFGFDQELVNFTDGKGTILAPSATLTSTGTATTALQPAGTSTPAATSPLAMVQDGLAPAVAVKGQIAYIGTGTHLDAIDISQPGAPRLAAQSPELPGKVIKVIPLPNGQDLHIAASAGRYIAVFDTAATCQLGLITQSKLPGPVTTLILDVNMNWIYAGGTLEGDPNKGFVTILDATPPDTLQLLATIQLTAPVQSLALGKSVLYVAQNGDLPKVSAIPVQGDQFGTPLDVHFSALPIYSMTTAADTLYIGSNRVFSALDISNPLQPKGAWDMDQSGGKPLPGKILGFELRASAIYIAGLDDSGKPFRMAVTPPQPIKASSTVDTASYIAVANGLMLVAGDSLELYDIRDPRNLPLIGSYPLP